MKNLLTLLLLIPSLSWASISHDKIPFGDQTDFVIQYDSFEETTLRYIEVKHRKFVLYFVFNGDQMDRITFEFKESICVPQGYLLYIKFKVDTNKVYTLNTIRVKDINSLDRVIHDQLWDLIEYQYLIDMLNGNKLRVRYETCGQRHEATIKLGGFQKAYEYFKSGNKDNIDLEELAKQLSEERKKKNSSFGKFLDNLN